MTKGVQELLIDSYQKLCDLHEEVDCQHKLKISKVILQVLYAFEKTQRKISMQ